MIKAIISDLGRVILDFDHDISISKLVRLTNIPVEEFKTYIYQSKIEIAFDTGEISAEEFYKNLDSRFDFGISFDEFKEIFTDIFALKRDVADLLTELKERYKLCLLSNTNALHYEFCEKKYNILKIFDHHVLSYKIHAMKPHPRIYLEAVRLCGVRPEECVYIDDIEEFARAASNLKINAIHYKGTDFLKKELKRLNVM
jgi:putative hydrolase of the HAD superfamily